MVVVDDVHLVSGEQYSAKQIKETFEKGFAGGGIQPRYDDNENKYLWLFSYKDSEYGDDLTTDPMRYVGEKNTNPVGADQADNGGNGAILNSASEETPMFLFERVESNPTVYHFHGRVELADYEYNFRPNKGLKEFDFYLREINAEDSTDFSESDSEFESVDDLAPGALREISPIIRDQPTAEEEISHITNKEQQSKGNNEHESSVVDFGEWLEAQGLECQKTNHTDILAYADDIVVVVETKSLTRSNEREQIRFAIGQLLENSYRDVNRRGWRNRDQILCLGFSRAPSDKYSGYLEYLREYGIETLWIEDDDISGHPESLDRIEQD